MNLATPRVLTQFAVVAVFLCGTLWAWFRPAHFASLKLLGAILFLEVLLFFVWHFERLFFVIAVLSFLLAGVSLPLQDAFSAARWVVLGVGAAVGLIIWTHSSSHTFGAFHLIAAFAVLAAAISGMESDYPTVSMSKAGSLFLLFLYGSTGARLAVARREGEFFQGLVRALEITVYITAVCYFVLGLRLFGNPNSLGAAMAIGVFPVLLWAFFSSQGTQRNFRLIALITCCVLLLYSLSRAGILASLCVGLVMFVSLRQYKLLAKAGAFLALGLALAALFVPSFFDEAAANVTDPILYKGHKDQGILASRRSPWDDTVTSIKNHPFLGSGFGVSLSQRDPRSEIAKFSSVKEIAREHGSSYLAIAEWVGLLGILPFIGLLFLVVLNVSRVCRWMYASRTSYHYSIPLAMVLLAGLIHAGFEDWMFAVGAYPTIYFWTFAFLLVDLLPRSVARSVSNGAVSRWTYPWGTVRSGTVR